MKKVFAVILALSLCTDSNAQKDSIPFYHHTFGVDLIWLSKAMTTPLSFGGTDMNIDVMYRYQVNHKWGIQAGVSYRETNLLSPAKTFSRIQSEGYALRLGPIFAFKPDKREETHLTVGTNLLVSLLTERNTLIIPNGLWGDFKDSYTQRRNRFGAELEIGLEGSLFDRFGARVLARAGYAPNPIDKYGLKWVNYAGIYSWLSPSDTYFYLSLLFFVRAGKAVK